MALKFSEHFLWISRPRRWDMGGDTGMWDEEDGFYYDVLRLPNGQAQRLKVRSMVGLLPLCVQPRRLRASSGARTIPPSRMERLQWFLLRLAQSCVP